MTALGWACWAVASVTVASLLAGLATGQVKVAPNYANRAAAEWATLAYLALTIGVLSSYLAVVPS